MRGGETQARPLTDEETRVFRASPPIGETSKTPEALKRFQAAQTLAHKLGMEGNSEAVPLLVELRQIPLLNSFAGSYSGPATPELESLALRHMGDPEIASRLVALLRRLRSAELFEALLRALPEGKIDCALLLGAASSAEVDGVEPRLAKLLPAIHPAFGRFIAKRFADSQYTAGEKLLIDLLRRTPLDRGASISGIAQHLVRLPSVAALDATARKLIEIAKLPEDKSPPKLGLLFSIRNEDIPKDGLLCSTEALRMPQPLEDARSRVVADFLRLVPNAFPEATLDRSLFDASALAFFSPGERKAVEAMLAERARVETLARDVTTDNFMLWISRSVDPRMVKRFIERGIDVNAPGTQGERPLVHAAQRLNADAVALLLAAGADPNLANTSPDREGDSALHAVSRHNGTVAPVIESGVRVTKLLLAKKADPQLRNQRGATPLQFAAAQRPELAMLLLDAGASVNAADMNGSTPLHRAVHGGQRALALLLLERGANVNAEEMGGITPLLIARENKDAELESLLAARGGRINQAYVLKRKAVELLLFGPRSRE